MRKRPAKSGAFQRGRFLSIYPPTWRRKKQKSAADAAPPASSTAAFHKEAVEKAMRAARTSWLFLLTLSLVAIVTIASVSHADLLLNAPVKLPVVQIGVPVDHFFVFMPLLLLVAHMATLLQHADLARKIGAAISKLSSTDRQLLPGYHLLQMAAGPPGLLHKFYTGLHWLTLMAFPLAVLIYAQAAYLPLHDLSMTYWHRLIIMADITAISLYYYGSLHWLRRTWRARLLAGLNFLLLLFITFFIFFVATIPGERQERLLCPAGKGVHEYWCTKTIFLNRPRKFLITTWLFEGDINRVSRRPNSLFSRNIVIIGEDLSARADGAKLDLRGRDLRYAIFDNSTLAKADFTGSDLTEANFKNANLKGAIFACASPGKKKKRKQQPTRKKALICSNQQYSHTGERCTKLNYANLDGADLTQARFNGAVAIRASFTKATMVKAKIEGSCMFATWLSNSNLQGATIMSTNMVGADLSWAEMQGIKIGYSDLSLADLSNSNLKKAKIFFDSNFINSYLTNSDLRYADLSFANLKAANLTGIRYCHTIPPNAKWRLEFILMKKAYLNCERDKKKNENKKGNINNNRNNIIFNEWWKNVQHILGDEPENFEHSLIDYMCQKMDYIIYELFYGYGWDTYWDVYDEVYTDIYKDIRIEKIPNPPKTKHKKIKLTTKNEYREKRPPSMERLWSHVQAGKCKAAKELPPEYIQEIKRRAMLERKARNERKKPTHNTHLQGKPL